LSRYLDAIRSLYPHPGWGVYAEVSTATGDRDGGRRADFLAVACQPSGKGAVVLFEQKESKRDFDREVFSPEKGDAFGRYCTQRYFIVPAPWKSVVLTERQVPRGWGLLEVGTGSPREIVEAPKTQALEMPHEMVLSLLRAAAVQGTGAAVGVEEQVITFPNLGGGRVGLACGHTAVVMVKKQPAKWPCFSCQAGLPTEVEVVEGAIAAADPDQLEAWLAQIARQLGRDAA
jgi:hypothetical protein